MTAGCPDATRKEANTTEYIPNELGVDQWILSAEVRCANYSPLKIEEIGGSMLDRVTIVNADKLEVNTKPYFEGFSLDDDLELLTRHGSTATFLSIALAATIAVIVRVGIKMLFNNDAHLAVEVILKDRLGMKCCDSMLHAENLVHFKGDVEVENSAHLEISDFDLGHVQALTASREDGAGHKGKSLTPEITNEHAVS